MTTNEALKAFGSALDSVERILLTTHINPDGDAIGSVLALRGILRMLGKQAEVVMSDRIPDKYLFLVDEPVFQADDPAIDDMVAEHLFEMIIFTDASERERAGLESDRLEKWLAPDAIIVNIDHHVGNTGFGDIVILDGARASTAELVMDVAVDLGIQITKANADQLFAAILTDTGRFQYSNTTPESLSSAGRLVEAGADPSLVTDSIYHHRPAEFYRLVGSIFGSMDFQAAGRICVMCLTSEMAEEFFPDGYIDTEGIVDFSVQIEGVELGVFIKQVDGDAFRASLRSRGTIDVRAIAESFGGGGHEKAAGCRIGGTLEEVKAKVVAAMESHF
jgi:phosphoesterase RecJ-like protein